MSDQGHAAPLRVAVISLTRDRLAYTQHCFQTLRDNAGCDYDHYILDQGSSDGTPDWLLTQEDLDVTVLTGNAGISRGLNCLLDEAVNPADYDVIVKFDNDCELLTPNTLHDVAALVADRDVVASPRIHGLRNPPQTIATVDGLDVTMVIGGIFMAVPAHVFAGGYRHDETNPVWGGDDYNLCAWWRRRGGLVGYAQGYDANHYLTTDGQAVDDTDYWTRKTAEMTG